MRKFLLLASSLLVASSLHGEDFSQLMQVARNAWPEKSHVGVVCDYRFSTGEVASLAANAGGDSVITVLDVRNTGQAVMSANRLKGMGVDYMVLLVHDPIVRDGGLVGTQVVRRVAEVGIPSLGTTPQALIQGAAFAVGEGTGNQLLVTDSLIGTVGVTLPERGHKISAFTFPGSAEVRVVAAR